MLQCFNVECEDVQENYDEDHTDKHYQPLEVLAEEDSELKALLLYIKNKRIEIDSVLTVVGNEHFWNFCLGKLKELFPNRNYNRAIEVPQDLIPEEVEDFINDVKKICNKITGDQRDEIEGGLENVEGFVDDAHDNEGCIKKRIRDVLSDDEEIQSLVTDIQVLQDKLRFEKKKI